MAKKIKYEKINPKPPLREDAAVEEAQEALENPEETAASETTSEPSPLEEALKQAAEYKDMALRQRAEFENYRKRDLVFQLRVLLQFIINLYYMVIVIGHMMNMPISLIMSYKTHVPSY